MPPIAALAQLAHGSQPTLQPEAESEPAAPAPQPKNNIEEEAALLSTDWFALLDTAKAAASAATEAAPSVTLEQVDATPRWKKMIKYGSAAVDKMETKNYQEEMKPLTDLSQDSLPTAATEVPKVTPSDTNSAEDPEVTMPPDTGSTDIPQVTPPDEALYDCNQPPIYIPQDLSQWMYWDYLEDASQEDSWEHWQMVDETHHDELEEAAAKGGASVELMHKPRNGKEQKWCADLEAMNETRWRGNKKGGTRQLMQVDMMIFWGGSQPTDMPGGFEFVWQYLGDWGWKNVEPISNKRIIAAEGHGQDTVTFTHAWKKHKKDSIMRDEYTIDFNALEQRAVQGNKTKRSVRLVAWRKAEPIDPVDAAQSDGQ